MDYVLYASSSSSSSYKKMFCIERACDVDIQLSH